jgi:hypothetical protein
LKFVSDETGQGIAYREKLSDGKSIQQILKGGGKAPAAQEEVVEEAAEVTSIAEAAKIIRDGGPLSSISPSILAEALTKANLFQRNKDTYATNRAGTYKMQSSKGSGDHLSAGLASEIQSHLGLKSPDIAAVGKGDKKKYLSEVAESAASGFSVDKTSKFNDLPTSQVAALMVSDILADIPARTTNSVAIMKKGDEIAAFPDIAKSELIDLSDIKVRERTSARIREFASVSGDGLYTKYYRELKDDQRRLLQQQIDELIEKAREFNFTKYRERLYRDGELSKAEKVHLNIIQKIVANRVDVLRQSRDQLMSVLGGKK